MTLSGRTGTVVVVALVVSVCLNVFIAGLVIGRVSGGRGAAPDQPTNAGGLERFMATVPAEARPVIRRAMVENRRDLQGLVAAVREARRAAAAAVAREPFDPVAFQTAMATVRERSDALQAEVHAIIAEALDDLSPELRSEMAERWGARQ